MPRLGMSPEHKNVLLRLIFRDLDRTLSSAQANRLRDLVYAGLHVGSAAQWASDPRESTAAALSTLTKQRLHSEPTSLGDTERGYRIDGCTRHTR